LVDCRRAVVIPFGAAQGESSLKRSQPGDAPPKPIQFGRAGGAMNPSQFRAPRSVAPRDARLFLALCRNGNSHAVDRMVDIPVASYLGDEAYRGANMDIKTRAIEHGHLNDDVKRSAEELAALFRGLLDTSTNEIEKLVSQLQRLRTQLETAGNRIERDIAGYTELSQQSMQLTAIITDSVKNLPDGTRQKELH
jgi:hypothetical protein